MSWAIGWDRAWQRDIGYAVPATCDHPGCDERIDRGLSHVCGAGEPMGGEEGCGLYFCLDHLSLLGLCERCCNDAEPFEPKPDCLEWCLWKLTHESWHRWRQERGLVIR